MSRRDKIFIALGGLLGAGLYLFFAVWLRSFGYPASTDPELGRLLTGTVPAIALGCMAGLATRPFADEGPVLLRQSLVHYLCTVALFAALVRILGGSGTVCGVWAGILSVLYLGIWLARWIGWYLEVVQLRRLLGLAPGPSPLKWRETLPYLPYAVVLCDALPLGAWLLDRLFSDVPVLCGFIVPYLLLPIIGFVSGLSLGKRQGVCILYPAACFVLYLPLVFILFNSSALFHCFMVAVPALMGNVLGWLYRRAVPKNR